MRYLLIAMLSCVIYSSCKHENKVTNEQKVKEIERLAFWVSLSKDHPFTYRAIALGEQNNLFKYWKTSNCNKMSPEKHLVSGQYLWNDNEDILTLTNDFGSITLHKEIIDGEEVLINKARQEHRVSKEGWILIRSKHASLEDPLAP